MSLATKLARMGVVFKYALEPGQRDALANAMRMRSLLLGLRQMRLGASGRLGIPGLMGVPGQRVDPMEEALFQSLIGGEPGATAPYLDHLAEGHRGIPTSFETILNHLHALHGEPIGGLTQAYGADALQGIAPQLQGAYRADMGQGSAQAASLNLLRALHRLRGGQQVPAAPRNHLLAAAARGHQEAQQGSLHGLMRLLNTAEQGMHLRQLGTPGIPGLHGPLHDLQDSVYPLLSDANSVLRGNIQ